MAFVTPNSYCPPSPDARNPILRDAPAGSEFEMTERHSGPLPGAFRCASSQQPFDTTGTRKRQQPGDPLLCLDGFTYRRDVYERSQRERGAVSPVTGEVLLNLQPTAQLNLVLRNAQRDFPAGGYKRRLECPFNQEPFQDAVMAWPTGHTYNRLDAVTWFTEHRNDPNTGKKITGENMWLVPNRAVQKLANPDALQPQAQAQVVMLPAPAAERIRLLPAPAPAAASELQILLTMMVGGLFCVCLLTLVTYFAPACLPDVLLFSDAMLTAMLSTLALLSLVLYAMQGQRTP